MAKKKRSRGRPKKLSTNADRERFLKLLKQCSGILKHACRKFGIAFQTLHNERLKDEEFAGQVADATEEVLDSIEHNVMATAQVDAAIGIRVLKCKRPEIWSEKQIVSHEGTVGIQIVEEQNWYGNDAHGKAAEAASSPTTGDTLASPNEGDSLRQTLGKDIDSDDVQP